MAVFYEKRIKEGVKVLSEEESRHCTQVLRHNSGDEILIFDGNGGKHRAKLNEVSKKSCSFEIIESEIEPRKKFYTHLAIAPTKNADRMEWMVEKLGEIGVDELSFIQTQHSERKHLRTDRLEKKTISAMKQSGNPFKLQINEMMDFNKFIDQTTADQNFIAHVKPSHPYFGDATNNSNKICILIGPEGDFSEQELNLAMEKGFTPISLGNNTLRTETAGFAACCIVNVINKY